MGRAQVSEYGGFKSELLYPSCGVAQGSKLEPLFSIIFYNDAIPITNCKTLIYASDLKIAYVINSFADCLELQSCFDNNKLLLNLALEIHKLNTTRQINSKYQTYLRFLTDKTTLVNCMPLGLLLVLGLVHFIIHTFKIH